MGRNVVVMALAVIGALFILTLVPLWYLGASGLACFGAYRAGRKGINFRKKNTDEQSI